MLDTAKLPWAWRWRWGPGCQPTCSRPGWVTSAKGLGWGSLDPPSHTLQLRSEKLSLAIFFPTSGGGSKPPDKFHLDWPSYWQLFSRCPCKFHLQVDPRTHFFRSLLSFSFSQYTKIPWQKLTFLASCLFVSGAFGFLVPFVSNFYLILPVLLATGITIGSFNTANNSLVVYMIGPKK